MQYVLPVFGPSRIEDVFIVILVTAEVCLNVRRVGRRLEFAAAEVQGRAVVVLFGKGLIGGDRDREEQQDGKGSEPGKATRGHYDQGYVGR